MDDDGTGWNELLLSLWSGATRDAVVTRIEGALRGRRGWLVRVFADPDGVRPELTETVHAVVLAGIRDETGADLDALGSQAAWDCYEQVWAALGDRWADGGSLASVPLTKEPSVDAFVRTLPTEAAVCAGADVLDGRVDPLWLRGRLRVDVDGLRAYLALDGGLAPEAVHTTIMRILREAS